MQIEQFNSYWDGSNSEPVTHEESFAVQNAINDALLTNPVANTQNVYSNMFEWKAVKPIDGKIEFREQNPDKYFAYLGPKGEVPGVVNINVRDPKTGEHIGYVNADGQFVKGEYAPKSESVVSVLVLAKANGKYAAWPSSILKTNPTMFVLELNAYLFT